MQESYYYQIFLDQKHNLVLPSVQQLLEHSFHTEGLKLAEVSSLFFFFFSACVILMTFLIRILTYSSADGDPNGHFGYCSKKNK